MRKVFFVAVVLALLSGCSTLDSKLEREFNEVRDGPTLRPYKSLTDFSEALVCMDNLMLKKGVKAVPIMVEDIGDKTESVPVGVKDMLVSAISEMTAKSQAIRLIVYGKDTGNLISFMKAAKNDQIYKQAPLFDIQGSISQFDKGMTSSDSSLGLFYRRKGGLGLSRAASLSVVALDLNMVRANDMAVVSGVSSRNSVAIFQRGDSLDADASINKLGVYFDINLNRNEGKAQAVRSLVELGAIELIGKLVKVPYEQCLRN